MKLEHYTANGSGIVPVNSLSGSTLQWTWSVLATLDYECNNFNNILHTMLHTKLLERKVENFSVSAYNVSLTLLLTSSSQYFFQYYFCKPLTDNDNKLHPQLKKKVRILVKFYDKRKISTWSVWQLIGFTLLAVQHQYVKHLAWPVTEGFLHTDLW